MGQASLEFADPWVWDGKSIACPILDPKVLSKFLGWQEELPKFHPTFKIGFDT
jgi:hypothetical protein